MSGRVCGLSAPNRCRHSRGCGRLSTYLHSVNDLAEYDVLAVQPWGLNGGDKELRSVRVRPRVGHGQVARSLVREVKVLILKLPPVDGLAANTSSVCDIASLQKVRAVRW